MCFRVKPLVLSYWSIAGLGERERERDDFADLPSLMSLFLVPVILLRTREMPQIAFLGSTA